MRGLLLVIGGWVFVSWLALIWAAYDKSLESPATDETELLEPGDIGFALMWPLMLLVFIVAFVPGAIGKHYAKKTLARREAAQATTELKFTSVEVKQ